MFISYSHRDDKLRQQINTAMTPLLRESVVEHWHDRMISAGMDWASEIDEHLKHANIILLLVSPDFMASQYCYGVETQVALERHAAREARVIPVILRPADWANSPIGRLQALPKDAKAITRWRNRDEAIYDVIAGIRKVTQDLRSH
jgi:hypothetical protein